MILDVDSYAKIVDDLYDGLYIVDTNRVIQFWNKSAERISGFLAEEVVGKSCSDDILTHVCQSGTKLCTGKCPLAASMVDGARREAEVYMHHKNGYRIPVSVRVSPLRDSDGNITGGIELFSDISNKLAAEERVKELEKLALLDKLTQLANRHYLEQELESRFTEREKFGIPFGVMFIDIDDFKLFNDQYGHDIGDKVLRFIADSMTSTARVFDLYGRWGGEEFLGVIRNVEENELKMVAERVRFLVENSYLLHDTEKLSVTISIGVTMATDGDDIKTIIKRSDELLYKSKSIGKNCISVG